MACAQTGSGKTAAFLVPILSRIFQEGPPPTPDVSAAPYGFILKSWNNYLLDRIVWALEMKNEFSRNWKTCKSLTERL